MSDMDYCNMLIDALKKKVDLLDLLLKRTKEQTLLLQDETSRAEDFDKNVALKAELIDSIEKLDQGFELLFARIKDNITQDTITYGNVIIEMQKLIRQVTELSVQLETTESYNKDIAKRRFATARTKYEVKKSSKAVSQYYKTVMASSGQDGTKKIDKKK